MRIAILLLAVSLCFGQGIPGIGGIGALGSHGAAGYTGPGDLSISGIKAWWGLRCYSTAYTGSVADIWDGATGNTVETLLTCSAGGTINQTINPLSTTCAISCVVNALYDQSGANSCSAAACDAVNITNATRATYTQNCIGSLPCLTKAGGAGVTPIQKSSFPTSITQPYTVSTVCERTGANTTQAGCIWASSAGAFVGPTSSTNTWLQYAGSVANVTANDSVVHAAQAIFNGASSTFYIDGSSNATNAGTLATGGALLLMSDGTNALNGHFWEAGIWSGSFSGGQLSSMNSNQHSYWGF